MATRPGCATSRTAPTSSRRCRAAARSSPRSWRSRRNRSLAADRGGGRERPLRPLRIDSGAPLSIHQQHPGARLQLVCGACAWSRSYDPGRIIEGLRTKRLGDAQTAIAAVANHVHWPCPRCRRMRWGTRLAVPEPLR